MTKYSLQLYLHSIKEEMLDVNELEVHPEIIGKLSDLGIVEVIDGCIGPENLYRVRKMIRLKNSFSLNWQGAAIILDLLEQIEELQEEIEQLRKR